MRITRLSPRPIFGASPRFSATSSNLRCALAEPLPETRRLRAWQQRKRKTQIMAALNEAFAECDKAYESLTDANASEVIKTPRGQRTRLGALIGNTTHDSEQYGIVSVYMRLKGIVPPSSAGRSAK